VIVRGSRRTIVVVDGGLAVFGVGCGGGALAEVRHWWNLHESEQLRLDRADDESNERSSPIAEMPTILSRIKLSK
jgi:hypothetical protein